MACLIAVFLAIWWLYDGPRPVSFLNPYFEKILNQAGNGYRVTLGETMFSWGGWERALTFRLHDIKAIDPDGVTVADISEIAVGLNVLSLLRGEMALRDVAFFNPHFVVTMNQSGALIFEVPKTGQEKTHPGAYRVNFEQILANEVYSDLDSLVIHNARIQIKDQRHHISWLAEQANLSFSLDERILTGDFSADLAIESGSLSTMRPYLDADGHRLKIGRIGSFLRYDLDTGKVDIDGHTEEVQTHHLALLAPDLEFLEMLDLTASGEVSVTLHPGDIPQIGFSFYSRKGNLDVGLGPGQLSVNDLSVYGRLAPDGENLLIDQLEVASGDIKLSGSAAVGWNDQGVSLRGAAVLRDLPAISLGHYWPRDASDFVKTWLTENLNVGSLTKADTVFSFFLPSGDGHAPVVRLFHGSFEFDDVTVAFLESMPPVTAVRGRGFFSRDQVNIIIDEGQVDGVTAEAGVVSLTRLDTDFEHAHIEASTNGSLPELMRVLDHDPLRAAAFLGVDPATTRGTATARGVFSFPMVRHLSLDQLEIAATLDLRDSVLREVVAGHALENGILFLSVDKEKMTVEGSGQVEGVDIQLSGTEYFADSGSFKARYMISGVIEGDIWDRFGFTPDPFVSGPVAVDLIWTNIDAKKSNLAIAADLSNATLDLPVFDWVKEAGIPGTAQLTFSLKENALQSIDGFSVNTDGFQAAGQGAIGSESGQLEHLVVSRLRFGRSDFAAEIIPGDRPLIRLDGKSIDLEPFFNRNTDDLSLEASHDAEALFPDFFADMRVDHLWVGDDAKLSDVSGNLEYRDGVWRSIYLASMGDSGHKTRLRVSPDPDLPGRYIRFLTEDAGYFLRSLDLYSHMTGGTLLLEGRIDEGDYNHPITGEIDISDFEIVESPVFARLLSLPSPDGLIERLGGGGLGFRKLIAPFQFVDQSLKIDQGRAFGALGLTFGGIFDFRNDRVDMAGSIVPSYALNSIWGGIPIIGNLLTGFDEGGGIFALTYRVSGNWEKPQVTINPLSALTPGILREFITLFEGKKPETSFSSEEQQLPERQLFP